MVFFYGCLNQDTYYPYFINKKTILSTFVIVGDCMKCLLYQIYKNIGLFCNKL